MPKLIKNMKIAICEDIKEDSTHLYYLITNYINANGLTADIEVFASGEALLDTFSSGKYNMLFQDIYMDKDKLTGMQVAKKIRELDDEIAIIFTTTSNEHGSDSYDVNASYYIVKPIEKDKLKKAMEKCHSQLNRYARTIEIIENRRAIEIRLRDVYYTEAIGHNTLIHTVSGEIRTRTAFNKFIEKLEGFPFVSCHRSYVVNLTHVSDMAEKDFIMKNGDKVPISKTYQLQVQKAFREYFWGNCT